MCYLCILSPALFGKSQYDTFMILFVSEETKTWLNLCCQNRTDGRKYSVIVTWSVFVLVIREFWAFIENHWPWAFQIKFRDTSFETSSLIHSEKKRTILHASTSNWRNMTKRLKYRLKWNFFKDLLLRVSYRDHPVSVVNNLLQMTCSLYCFF